MRKKGRNPVSARHGVTKVGPITAVYETTDFRGAKESPRPGGGRGKKALNTGIDKHLGTLVKRLKAYARILYDQALRLG